MRPIFSPAAEAPFEFTAALNGLKQLGTIDATVMAIFSLLPALDRCRGPLLYATRGQAWPFV
jgi:hypothetical protein